MNVITLLTRIPALILSVVLFFTLGCSGAFLTKKEIIITRPESGAAPEGRLSTTGPGKVSPTTASERELYNQAEKAWYQNQLKEALQKYQAFLAAYPASALRDQARFTIGLIYEKLNQTVQAATAFQECLKESPDGVFSAEIRLRLAKLLNHGGRYDQALTVLTPLSGTKNPQEQFRYHMLSGQAWAGKKDYIRGMEWSVKALNLAEDKSDKIDARDQVTSMVSLMPIPRLAEAKKIYKKEFPASYIAYFYIYRLYQAGHTTEARAELNRFFESFPGDELTEKAHELEMAIMDSRPVPALGIKAPKITEIPLEVEGPSRRLKVSGPGTSLACLLPLTGGASKYGQMVLQGLRLAFKLYEPRTKGFSPNLIVLDTTGEPDRAVRAVEQLAGQREVLAVIGPLTTREASETAVKAEKNSLPMLSLSQAEGVPQAGRYIFRFFLTPEAQAKAVAEYAVQILGLNRLAMLSPMDDYGKKMRDSFLKEAKRLKAEVVGVEFYPPQTTDFSEQIRKLAGLKGAERVVSAGYTANVGFQAVFLPDDCTVVSMIAPQFAYHDITNIRLLGTTLWHNPRLLETSARYLQKSIFPTSFFPDMSNPAISRFVEAFRLDNEGRDPERFEAYGFDAGTLLLSLMDKEGITSREDMVKALQKVVNFPGVTSYISFTPEGDLKTIPPLLTITGNEFRLIQ